MPPEKEIYEARVRDLSVSAADHTLRGDFVPSGRIVKLETFLALDETTANKTITLGIETRTGITTPIKTAAAGAGVYGIYLDTPLILVEGERPYAKIASATASDNLQLLARGIYI